MKASRHSEILRQLRLRGTVDSEALARRLHVSAVSVRRDLRELELAGSLRRVHGGATVPRHTAQSESALDIAALGLHTASVRPDAPLAVVGVVVPTTGRYFSGVIEGAKQAAHAAGVRLLLAASDYDARREIELIRRFVTLGADAIVLTPSSDDLSIPALRATLDASPVPMVVLERAPDSRIPAPRFDAVRTDHAFGAETAVRHLYDAGKRRIALLGLANAAAHELHRGYSRAITALGTEPVVLEVGADRNDTDLEQVIARCLLELDRRRVNGVVINLDIHADAFADALAARGTRIPEDLGIVAYDDTDHEREVPLTAVVPPRSDLGATAIALCLQRLRAQTEKRHRATSHTVLLPELVVRRSTLAGATSQVPAAPVAPSEDRISQRW